MADEIDPKGWDSSEHTESSIEIIPNSKIGKYEVANLPVTATPMSGPSKPSQAMAFGSILLGGLCGGLIGFAFTDLQCSGSCTGASGISALIGAMVGAGGVGRIIETQRIFLRFDRISPIIVIILVVVILIEQFSVWIRRRIL